MWPIPSPSCARRPSGPRWRCAQLASGPRPADYQGRSLKSQFKQADKHNARLCVVLGPDEVAAGVATVRDMGTHEQVQVPMADLAAKVSELLG